MTQRKIDMLVERLNQLQLDVERRFGQLRSGLLLISLIVLVPSVRTVSLARSSADCQLEMRLISPFKKERTS